MIEINQSSISSGSSISCLKCFDHSAAIAPSTILWSELRHTLIKLPTLNSPSLSTITSYSVELTARIQAEGGFTIAVKLWTPNIPRFEIVNVTPVSSWGFNLFSLALPAISLISVEICSNPFKLVFYKTGDISPLSVWTATDILTFLNNLIESPIQAEFV